MKIISELCMYILCSIVVVDSYLSEEEDNFVLMLVLHVQLQLAGLCCPEVSLQFIVVGVVVWLYIGVFMCVVVAAAR